MRCWEYAVADSTKLEGAVPELDRLGAEGSIVLTWACTDRRLAAVGPFVVLSAAAAPCGAPVTRLGPGVGASQIGPYARGPVWIVLTASR